MPVSMPVSLLAAFVLFAGFVSSNQRHASNFHGTSAKFLQVLQASVVLGTFVGIGMLIFYFTKVSWYWPLILFAISAVLAGLLFGILDAVVGKLQLSFLALLGWPASAVWAIYTIASLGRTQ